MAEREPAGSVPAAGDLVLAAGTGVTGMPVVRFLAARGVRVVVTSSRPRQAELDELAALGAGVTFAGDLAEPPPGTAAVITSAGIPPTQPMLAAAARAGIEVIGEVELAWRVDRSERRSRPWLVITGTNGKTTATGMLESILRAAGRTVTACGNIGWPVLDAVTAAPDQDVIAAELSSFQLHWAPGVRPFAGAVLNVAEDHLDWHGSLAAYAAAKARALTGEVAVAVVDDPGAAALLRASAAARRVAVSADAPAPGGLGVRGGQLVDDAFTGSALLPAADIRPPGAHNVTNALAAAALALADGVPAAAVADGLRSFVPGGHRNVVIGERAGVLFVDDSKATNPHAALASLLAYERVVWVAGGQLKGASVDDLARRIEPRLAGAVLMGVDAPAIDAALSRHAPDVPRLVVRGNDDDVMRNVVRAAVDMAAPGDVVLLAPAAASLDMFSSYAARGDAFAAAVRELPAPGAPGTGTAGGAGR